MHAKSLWLCLTLCNPMDCSLPGSGSSVHGIFQARILELVAMPFSFLTQGLNPRLLRVLHWQAGSLPLVPLGKSPLHTPVFLGFPGGSAGKEPSSNVGDLVPSLGWKGIPVDGNGCPLRLSGLENSMDCTVHRVSKNQTRLSNFHFHLVLKSESIYIYFK